MRALGVAITVGSGVFLGMMISLEIGYRFGQRKARDPESRRESSGDSTGIIAASIFGLLGLLLGFSFAGGTSRLESKRGLAVQEANAIGTAYLRLDLLADPQRAKLRTLFREYLDARLAVQRKLPDLSDAEQELARVAELQQSIWSHAVNASKTDGGEYGRLVLPPINEMIDITTSRAVAYFTHLPGLIFTLLITVALITGLLAGHTLGERRKRSWFYTTIYALVVSLTIYAVVDLDNPRSGLIRLDAADAAMTRLRDSIR